jgi:hypothetical protein
LRGPATKRSSREALEKGIHLAVLSALALAQPVFDILGRNATFFAVRDSSSTAIVLFAVALTVLPPTVLILVELLTATLSRDLARAVHLFFLGTLAALLALVIITKTGALTGGAAVALAAATGCAAALLYSRARAARSFLTLLAPAPLLFLALFLLHSPVSKLVFADTPTVQAAPVRARTPVVLIVFDEFSTVALMNRRQEIDAGRFPNFGSLASDSTWFRSATTKAWLSEVAVPSLLTGSKPARNRLPIFSDYPRNIFTLLGGSYDVVAIESITRLCPPTICREARRPQAGARTATGAYGSLASDVGIVYLHLLLPDPYASRLPHIDDSWGDFGGREEPGQTGGSPGTIEPCARNVCQFADLITADRRPTFYFLHAMLPHVPYVYLPSGRRYVIDARVVRGMETGVWTREWPALQTYQRYLLQVAYTDRALGHLLRRLRSTGVYDRALVIVTADHGVSFRLGEPRRAPTPANFDDIAFVPLFVKLPGQTRGRIVDSNTSTIDVLPTIARVLGVSLPWRVDGRPLVGRQLPDDGLASVLRDGRWIAAPLAEVRARRARTLARQVAVFGSGSLQTLYRIGPHRELLGRSVASLSVRPSVGRTVELMARTLLAAVDRDSDVLPSYVDGKIKGPVAPDQALAVAVNGRIAATTRTFAEGAKSRFSAFVPESALHAGENAVAVYVILDGGPRPVLEQLRDDNLSFTLAERNGRELIESGSRRIAIRPGVIRGTVRVASEGTGFAFSGHAMHVAARRPIHTLVVFADGRAVYWGRSEDLRPNRLLGQSSARKDAFAFVLPRSLLPPRGGEHDVRVFAIRLGLASELRYVGQWFWAR